MKFFYYKGIKRHESAEKGSDYSRTHIIVIEYSLSFGGIL